MTKKTETLEDFVKAYVQNKAKSNSPESYQKWLIANGINSDGLYSESIRDATADYKTAKSEYGRLAEGLASLGLSGSGYSDYLNGKAYSDMQRRKADARSERAENERKNASGYQSYLKSKSVDRQGVIDAINDAGISDYEAAYNYAVNAGLTENEAKAAAKIASDMARKKIKDNIMKTILTASLTETQAKQYSLGLGLSEEEAEALAKYAASINEYVSDYNYSVK